MPLTKQQKSDLRKAYEKDISGAQSVVILKQDKIGVNEISKIRNEVRKAWGSMKVIKKTIFFDVAKKAGLEGWELADAQGSAIAVFLPSEDMSGLKIFVDANKKWKKAEAGSSVDFSWGWMEKQWKDSKYMSSIATLPTKQELLWSIAYMLQYPLTQLAMVIDKVREQKEWK